MRPRSKQVSPEKLARYEEVALQLDPLKRLPAWEMLRQVAEERRGFHEKRLLKNMLAGRPVDQREIDRQRGFWEGVEFVLAYPDFSQKRLENALSAQPDEQEQ